jgi:hypothetical protein
MEQKYFDNGHTAVQVRQLETLRIEVGVLSCAAAYLDLFLALTNEPCELLLRSRF